MPYCPLCNKPLMLVPSAFPENYCQCSIQGITIHLAFSESTETYHPNCKLSMPPVEPERVAIPAAFQNAFKDGELSL